MMWKRIELLLAGVLFLTNCGNRKTPDYKIHPDGIAYKLISYEPGSSEKGKAKFLLLSLIFCTQDDSIFWDSYNNFNDLYVLPAKSDETGNLSHCLSTFVPGDSLLLLVSANKFFKEQFYTEHVPDFCAKDTIVKVRAKIQRFITEEELEERKDLLHLKESTQIQDYLSMTGLQGLKADSSGVFWIQKPEPFVPAGYKPGQNLKIQYEGRFLNGRLFEASGTDFDLFYGAPDQIIKGLNYVMQFLAEGQTAKIILPSALAFGNSGSSNGTVPPYTPVLYQIKCIHVKQK